MAVKEDILSTTESGSARTRRGIIALLRASPKIWIATVATFVTLCAVGVWAVCHGASAAANQNRAAALATAQSVASQILGQLTNTYSPIEVLSGMVQAAPDWETVERRFNATAPSLMAATTGLESMQMSPSGVLRLAEPANEVTLMFRGWDIFMVPDPGVHQAVVDSMATQRIAIAGPYQAFENTGYFGLFIVVFKAIFVSTSSDRDELGRPDPPSPGCGEPCAYRKGTTFWGFTAANVMLDNYMDNSNSEAAQQCPLRVLRDLGYAYRLVAANGEVVGASAAAPQDPVQALIDLPGTQWVLYVSLPRSWTPSWLPGAIVGVVLAALVAAALVFALLVSRRRHQALLEALLPKHVLQELHQQGAAQALAPRSSLQDSPAELLHGLLDCLTEGSPPDLRDVVLLRSLLLQSAPWYSPVDVGGKIKNANLDSEVERALMRQLGGGSSPMVHGAGSNRDRTSPHGVTLHGALGRASSPRTPGHEADHEDLGCPNLRGALALLLSPEAVPGPRGPLQRRESDALSSCSDLSLRAAPAPSSSGQEAGRNGQQPQPQHPAAAPRVPAGDATGPKPATFLSRLGSGLRKVGTSPVVSPFVTPSRLGGPPGGPAASASASATASPRGSGWTLAALRAPGEQQTEGGGAQPQDAAVPRGRASLELAAPGDSMLSRSSCAQYALGTAPQLEHRGSSGTLDLPGADGESEAGGPRGTGQLLQLCHTATVRSSTSGLQGGLGSEQAALAARGSRVRPTEECGGSKGEVQSGALAAGIMQRRRDAEVKVELAGDTELLGHVRAAPTAPLLDEVERLLQGVDELRYNTWALAEATGGHALSALGFYLLQREGLVARFGIPPLRLIRLLHALEAGYPASNPYHNATHAADVLRTLHVLLRATRFTAHYIDPLGLLAAYFAAIVHDHGHPGLTGDFLMATSHPLALRYNDRSPLESHHAASAFVLLAERPELNVLSGLSKEERASFRKQVIEMVLATDMKQHFALLGQFNAVSRRQNAAQHLVGSGGRNTHVSVPGNTSSNGTGGGNGGQHASGGAVARTGGSTTEQAPAPVPVDESERQLSLQMALKCADIGHLAGELSVHKRWLAVLEEEFFRQGDQERELGLPISPLFDRAKQGVSKSQVGFFDFVALPLLRAFAEAFPGGRPMLDCFEDNYRYWQREQQQQDKDTSRSGKVKERESTKEKDTGQVDGAQK